MTALTERQNEILEAALDLIAQKGIQGLTTKNLAHRLGITEPALYRHFKSKISILVTILSEYKHTLAQLSEQTDQDTTNPFKKSEIFFGKVFKLFTENPSLTSVIFAEEIFRNEKKLTQAVMEIMSFAHQRLASWIMECKQQKMIRWDIPNDHIIYTIMGIHRLLVTKWRMNHFGFDLMEEHRKIWKSLGLIFLQTEHQN